jgi:hypothetical protein
MLVKSKADFDQLTLPSWQELCAFVQHDEANRPLATSITSLKNEKPNFRYRFARRVVDNFTQDPAFRKFLNFSYEEIIDLMADQVARNSRISRNFSGGSKFSKVSRKYAQQPCTQQTVRDRVKKAQDLVVANQPILVLGDDDLVSLELARQGFSDVTAVDIDNKVLTAIQDVSRKENLGIKTQLYDLNRPADPSLPRNYALVFIDPIYSVDGVRLFLRGALELTNSQPGTKIFLSLHLMSLLRNGLPELEEILTDFNCRILEFHQGFNIYPIPKRVKGLIRLVNQLLIASKALTTEGYAFPYFLSDAIVLEKL